MGCFVFIATSLDGYIARRDGALDWLPQPGDASVAGEDHGYDAFIATIDAIVMGRTTFDLVLRSGWTYPRPIFVLTHRSLPALPAGWNVTAVAGTPHEVVAHLAAAGHHRLYVDGGATVTQFVDAGLVDRMTITRIPILLGDGIPLFGPLRHDRRWRVASTQTFPSGLQSTVYDAA